MDPLNLTSFVLFTLVAVLLQPLRPAWDLEFCQFPLKPPLHDFNQHYCPLYRVAKLVMEALSQQVLGCPPPTC